VVIHIEVQHGSVIREKPTPLRSRQFFTLIPEAQPQVPGRGPVLLWLGLVYIKRGRYMKQILNIPVYTSATLSGFGGRAIPVLTSASDYLERI